MQYHHILGWFYRRCPLRHPHDISGCNIIIKLLYDLDGMVSLSIMRPDGPLLMRAESSQLAWCAWHSGVILFCISPWFPYHAVPYNPNKYRICQFLYMQGVWSVIQGHSALLGHWWGSGERLTFLSFARDVFPPPLQSCTTNKILLLHGCTKAVHRTCKVIFSPDAHLTNAVLK